ncbi:hypothetical protein E1218_18615 [Kribbella turkmenica]|uniref:PASTA domain-containing protein n=1 Tax=Kribbella turkmenica TaxID=2530375 RepID=A0A4V2YFF0_9ACTN|nr:hypothetical protein [Kribbella turkmenica]TDD22927.1 hypothetical protein E1218_18615 [Kribbella turkmenica]
MRSLTVAAVVAAALLVACGNESGMEGQPTVSSTPSPETPSASPSPGTPTGAPPASGAVEQAKADLVKRLGIDPGQVTVVSATEVTWPDGSLGCPEPGMNYTQALVPGARIVLEAGGKQYQYHSGGTRPPFLCTNPR